MLYEKVPASLNFVEREKKTAKFWEENRIFEKSMKNRELAEKINWEADFLLKDGQKRCDALYTRVTEVL